MICKCCDSFYTSVGDAWNCISQNPDKTTTADDRLYLLAFVNNDLEKSQEIGWNILKDQDIIDLAKRKYLLVILDTNNITLPKQQDGSELLQIVRSHNENLFFVIANQALYPVADWADTESKEFIMDRLRVGAGP